jgi:chorismate mutase/prephenate dehydratase
MSLTELRNKINQLDKKLVELLNERARIVVEIGNLKKRSGQRVYAPASDEPTYWKRVED